MPIILNFLDHDSPQQIFCFKTKKEAAIRRKKLEGLNSRNKSKQ
jgi:hypothetical protein